MNAPATDPGLPGTRGLLHAFLAVLISFAPVARGDEQRVLELENGDRVGYALRMHPPDAHRFDAGAPLAPTTAVNTAKLLTRYLAEGRLEDAALLSNSPKARFARLRESFDGWSEGDFKRAYGRYFAPENRIVGEIAIDAHRLLMWYLSDTDYLTGFFLVEIDGKLLLDDVPNRARSNLQRVLEAYRSGRAN
ncbi:MAG: hypothetical protein HYX46_08215 [Betaproteobacteria bacterium]|nr:hypothetical protein [Betaproteobacteria bacterium]